MNISTEIVLRLS